MQGLRRFGSWLIVAVLFLATLVLVGGFFWQMTDTRPVIVARHGLLAGTRLTAEDVEVRTLHASAVLPAAVDAVEPVLGQLLSVPRLAGDQITQDMIGDQAVAGIATTLPRDHRAMAIRVTQETGLAGVLRAGDSVSVIAIIDTNTLHEALGLRVPPLTATVNAPGAQPGAGVAPETVSRLVLTDLKVLLVPQSFRYEEVPLDEETGDMSVMSARTTASAQATSVVVLDVPLVPIAIGGSATVSPTLVSAPELLALVNARGMAHLLLQPTDRVLVETPGLNLLDLVADILGWTGGGR
ncbi:MAG: Flp pilus assembly protein CpaB [Chloroflexi bacterium]|nr:Flp pilus assembly protein CpaB [Chloroflexota bacterium]MBU1747839.1 Flp pilus assembly protein CpaB [Chloroflexota bacterium]